MKPYLLLSLLLLTSCGEREPSETERIWDGAQVARICRDGSYIWRLKSGEHRTNWNHRVIDINTVCQ